MNSPRQNSAPNLGAGTTFSQELAARCQRTLATLLSCATLLLASAQTPPAITKQPSSGSRSPGDRYTFRVSVSGTPPMAYQWKFNGADIKDSTNGFHSLTALAPADAGAYSVTVTNPFGSATSDTAVLDIDSTFTVMVGSPIAQESGQGVSWIDFDGDGWIDFYAAGEERHLLYRNQRDGTFSDPLAVRAFISAGLEHQDLMGGFWGDYDNDGRPDLFATLGGAFTSPKNNQLFHNDGEGRFTRVTGIPPTTRFAASMQGLWGDYNRDGALDLFVVNSEPNLSRSSAIANDLYLGDGRGGFRASSRGDFFSLNLVFNSGATGDIDGDGDLDILVTAFGGSSNIILANNRQTAGFELNHLGSYGPWVGGCSLADYDNDGDLDLFVAYERHPALLFRNDGQGAFVEADNVGLSPDCLGALTGAWADYDNDGWLDLLVTSYRQYAFDGATPLMPDGNDFLYHNNGDGTFTRIKSGSVVNDVVHSFTAAWGDYDNDGFLDLAVGRCAVGFWSRGSSGVKNTLYHNNGNTNAWLTLKLVGTQSNKDAIGAKVFVKAILQGKSIRQFREINAGHGWASQDDIRAHFGLGNAKQADEIRIEWPSGKVTELKNIAAKQFLTVVEPDGRPYLEAVRINGTLKFTLVGNPGQNYAIETTSDLLSWSPLTMVTGRSEPVAIEDFLVGSATQRFYRAIAK